MSDEPASQGDSPRTSDTSVPAAPGPNASETPAQQAGVERPETAGQLDRTTADQPEAAGQPETARQPETAGSPMAAEPPGHRSRVPVFAVSAIAVILVAVVVALFVALPGREIPGIPRAAPPQIAPGVSGQDVQQLCREYGRPETVVVYFSDGDADQAMRLAAEQLREDPRVDSVDTETRQEAYERFKKIFADQPDLVDLAQPESLPASVTLDPADDISAEDLRSAIEAEQIAGADDVTIRCKLDE